MLSYIAASSSGAVKEKITAKGVKKSVKR